MASFAPINPATNAVIVGGPDNKVLIVETGDDCTTCACPKGYCVCLPEKGAINVGVSFDGVGKPDCYDAGDGVFNTYGGELGTYCLPQVPAGSCRWFASICDLTTDITDSCDGEPTKVLHGGDVTVAWDILRPFKPATITRIGSVAHVHCVGHGASTDDQVVITGADQSEYDNTFSAVVDDADNYHVTVSGTPTTPATGTITSWTVKDKRFTLRARGPTTLIFEGMSGPVVNCLDELYFANNLDNGGNAVLTFGCDTPTLIDGPCDVPADCIHIDNSCTICPDGAGCCAEVTLAVKWSDWMWITVMGVKSYQARVTGPSSFTFKVHGSPCAVSGNINKPGGLYVQERDPIYRDGVQVGWKTWPKQQIKNIGFNAGGGTHLTWVDPPTYTLDAPLDFTGFIGRADIDTVPGGGIFQGHLVSPVRSLDDCLTYTITIPNELKCSGDGPCAFATGGSLVIANRPDDSCACVRRVIWYRDWDCDAEDWVDVAQVLEKSCVPFSDLYNYGWVFGGTNDDGTMRFIYSHVEGGDCTCGSDDFPDPSSVPVGPDDPTCSSFICASYFSATFDCFTGEWSDPVFVQKACIRAGPDHGWQYHGTTVSGAHRSVEYRIRIATGQDCTGVDADCTDDVDLPPKPTFRPKECVACPPGCSKCCAFHRYTFLDAGETVVLYVPRSGTDCEQTFDDGAGHTLHRYCDPVTEQWIMVYHSASGTSTWKVPTDDLEPCGPVGDWAEDDVAEGVSLVGVECLKCASDLTGFCNRLGVVISVDGLPKRIIFTHDGTTFTSDTIGYSLTCYAGGFWQVEDPDGKTWLGDAVSPPGTPPLSDDGSAYEPQFDDDTVTLDKVQCWECPVACCDPLTLEGTNSSTSFNDTFTKDTGGCTYSGPNGSTITLYGKHAVAIVYTPKTVGGVDLLKKATFEWDMTGSSAPWCPENNTTFSTNTGQTDDPDTSSLTSVSCGGGGGGKKCIWVFEAHCDGVFLIGPTLISTVCEDPATNADVIGAPFLGDWFTTAEDGRSWKQVIVGPDCTDAGGCSAIPDPSTDDIVEAC